jgi:1-acylglycerone phosphate reductase
MLRIPSATPFSAGYGASKAAVRSLSDTLDMELRPLNVRVMLIEPGAIKSNMGNNNVATFEGLPSTSLYKTFETAIITRLTLSQGPKATPSAVFAKEMVDRALQVTPPRYFSSGHASTIAWIGSCLPRSIWLDYSWNVYSKMNKPL